MFTGIVRERGRIAERTGGPDGVRLVVEAPETAAALGVGDSVAINGCCLTAVSVDGARFVLEAVPETLRRTSLGALAEGDGVNVEPALRVGDPLGGHYVQGHVDAVGRIRSSDPEGDGRRVWIEAPEDVLAYAVEKGSIAVDGVSLTVAAVDGDGFSVSLIPETLELTTLGAAEPGRVVNLEVDVLAKYVEKLVAAR